MKEGFACEEAGYTWEISLLPSIFCREHKTARKNKYVNKKEVLKIKINKTDKPLARLKNK